MDNFASVGGYGAASSSPINLTAQTGGGQGRNHPPQGGQGHPQGHGFSTTAEDGSRNNNQIPAWLTIEESGSQDDTDDDEEDDEVDEDATTEGDAKNGENWTVKKPEESDSEAEGPSDDHQGLIMELAGSPVLFNVKLLCTDGLLEQNKLTVGLVFPAVKSADVFSFQAEPELIMAGYTRTEVRELIQTEFKKMYNKQMEKEKKKEDEDLVDPVWEGEDELEEDQPRPKRARKRGRPKGSTNKKKIKVEPDNWEVLEDFPELDGDLLENSLEVKDEEGRASKNTAAFTFPVNFDIKAANEKFNKLLDEVKLSSEKLEADLDKKDRWKCSLCGQVCANLAVHVGRNHADQDFSCSQCDVNVGSEYLLKIHEKTHLSEAKPCKVCGKVVKDMRNHMVQKHEAQSSSKIQCSQCPKVYVKNAEFQRHFNSAHLGIKANCPICHKELLPNKITSHVRMVHEKVKNHFCSSCGKGFYDKRDMELHIQRIHLGTKELCIECGKELSAGQLKNHIKKCHSGENFKVICPVCGKKVGYLDEHMRSVHKKEKNHQCPLCPLKCYKRNTLKRHLEWHEKGKLTVNGTPKKPRILKRDKDSEEPPQPQVAEMHPLAAPLPDHLTAQPSFHPAGGFPDPTSIMNLANFYRGHSM